MVTSVEHPVTTYLRAQQPPLSQKDFADKIGISDAYLSLIIDGKRCGPYDLHRRIEGATDGQITVAMMFDAHERMKANGVAAE